MSYCLEEAFEMACQIERNGAAFYRRAAETATAERARSLFIELANWELRHQEIFEQMRKEIPEDERTEYVDPYGDAVSYLDAMVAGKIFDAKKIDDAVPDSPADVLRAALGREKDSVVFYVGLKQAISRGAEQVDKIIEEEMRHIRILSDLFRDTVSGEAEG